MRSINYPNFTTAVKSPHWRSCSITQARASEKWRLPATCRRTPEASRPPEALHTPLRYDGRGGIAYWGNPSTGFVGDITGARRGYGVYHAPIAALMNRYLPGRALDLSGGSFDSVLDQVAAGKPVVVWTTVQFAPVNNWVSWNSPSGKVVATFSEHAAVLIGYDAQTVTLADPFDGQVDRVNRARFLASWEQMGRQAVTYR